MAEVEVLGPAPNVPPAEFELVLGRIRADLSLVVESLSSESPEYPDPLENTLFRHCGHMRLFFNSHGSKSLMINIFVLIFFCA